jgi:hypothetical protein
VWRGGGRGRGGGGVVVVGWGVWGGLDVDILALALLRGSDLLFWNLAAFTALGSSLIVFGAFHILGVFWAVLG